MAVRVVREPRNTWGRRMARLTGDDRWQKHGRSIIGHITQGAACGVAMAWDSWPIFGAGLAWMCWSYCYQHAGFLRKGDTIARDWRDYLAGFAPAWIATKLTFAIMNWLG